MLHSERRRQEEMARKEAAGESLWTEDFDSNIRVKIRRAFDQVTEGDERFVVHARTVIMNDVGLKSLHGITTHALIDFNAYLEKCPSSMVPTVIEALVWLAMTV